MRSVCICGRFRFSGKQMGVTRFLSARLSGKLGYKWLLTFH